MLAEYARNLKASRRGGDLVPEHAGSNCLEYVISNCNASYESVENTTCLKSHYAYVQCNKNLEKGIL